MYQQSGSYNGYVPGADGRPVRLAAQFSWVSKKTGDAANPFKKVAFITKFHAGSTDTTYRPVTEQDKMEYPQQWMAFEKGAEQDAIGWPIDQVPFLDVAQVDTYRFHGIKTLEALSGAPDQFLDQVMGGKEHKRKAQALLKSAIDSAPLMELTDKNKALEHEIEVMKRQMADLIAASGRPAQPAPAVEVARGSGKSKPLQPAVLPESDE